MASRIIELLGRIAAPLSFAFLGLFILICAFQKQQWDSDIFWALKSGEWIVSRLSVPHTDPFSYTFGGQSWVDFTWGFQVLAYLSHYLGGWAGLAALQAALVGLTFAFLYIALRALLPGRPWVAVSLVVLGYAAAHTRLFIRPHLFEFFFVSLYIMLLALHEKKGRPVYLFLIIPAQVLWINIHSSAVLGLFITGAYAAGKLADEVRARGLKNFVPGRGVLLPGLVALLAPVASLINPYGLKLVLFPFVHNGVDNADAIRHIAEWAKPGLRELFFLYPFSIDRFAFVVIFAGVCACLVFNWRSVRSWAYILFAGSVYMAASHVRWIPLFAVFGAPVLAMGLRGVLEKFECKAWPRAGAAVLAVVLITLLGYKHLSPGGAYASGMGVGIKAGKFPEGTVAYMKKEGLRGNIYNEYVFGGYLIYELPEVKVFIDGRTPTVYSSYFFWTSRVGENKGKWKKLQEEHGIDIALIKPESSLCSVLRASPEWSAVAIDEVSVLFLKRGAFAGPAKSGFVEFDPCTDGVKYRLPEKRDGQIKALSELEAVVKNTGPSARALRLMALIYLRLGQPDEAAVKISEALKIRADAYSWQDLGVALRSAKKGAQAIEPFKKAISIKPDFKEAYLGLAMAWSELGEHDKAIKPLEKYIELADDATGPEAYMALGIAWFHKGDHARAIAYLKRAAFLAEAQSDIGKTAYYLGSSYFELKEFGEGLSWYSKALAARADYKAVLKELASSHARAGRDKEAELILALPGVS